MDTDCSVTGDRTRTLTESVPLTERINHLHPTSWLLSIFRLKKKGNIKFESLFSSKHGTDFLNDLYTNILYVF